MKLKLRISLADLPGKRDVAYLSDRIDSIVQEQYSRYASYSVYLNKNPTAITVRAKGDMLYLLDVMEIIDGVLREASGL